ncbi:hypothetical protein [Naasia aerilata]|uniref:DUF1579 domain-containing protein n=1 Tax=Naasia aerilata TaxID=1162966 RepID=A0ABM8G9H1_9MICO|nr:hypothetical protein [Naasia aerilata]BDZ44791.1 hypothetical protein GCM10025866_07000 [Naasia aerilata]
MHETRWAPGGIATETSDATLGLDGLIVVQAQTQERNGGVAFAAHNVFTTDPATGEIVLYSFDSAGFLPDPPARGTWRDGELVLVRTTDRGQSRTIYRPRGDGCSWSKAFRPSDGDEWQLMLEGELD